MEKIFYSTENSEYLAKKIAEKAGGTFAKVKWGEFADGERQIIIEDPDLPRNKEVVVIGATENLKYFADLADLASALRTQFRAKSVELAIPYLGYSTMERLSKVRGEVARGIPRVQSLFDTKAQCLYFFDLHAEGIRNVGGRDGISEEIISEPLVIDLINKIKKETELVLISPDAGRGSWVKRLAELTDLPYEILNKLRSKTEKDSIKVESVNGNNLAGKTALIFDDMIRTGGTAIKSAERLIEAGANSVRMIATHAVIPENPDENIYSEEKLTNSPIEHFYVTNSHSRSQSLNPVKFTVLDISDIFAERIK